MPRNPSPMPTTNSRSDKLNVVIAGGGVAALETALALADLAPDRIDVSVIAPNSEFVYRPMVVREPFAYGAAHRYPLERIYAAGDATDFPIKHGGIGSQQADTAAQSIAALAGAPVTPERFDPTIHGMLLTNGKPRYLTAHIAGGHGFSSEIADTPTFPPPSKIAAKYLAPYLAKQDN
jgi:NADH dehydrogenase FAD-containing subunit